MRHHDVRTLTASELDRAKRELQASLALARPDSPVRVPILAQLSAIDTELAGRGTPRTCGPVIYLCSCGFGTDNHDWFQCHATEHPAHRRQDPWWDCT